MIKSIRQRQQWNEQTTQGIAAMTSQPQCLSDVVPTEELDRPLDSLIHELLRGTDDRGEYVDVGREHIEVVCSSVVSKFMGEPMVLDLECPITIVGERTGPVFPPSRNTLTLVTMLIVVHNQLKSPPSYWPTS